MQNLKKHSLLFLLLMMLSCEEVVEVDLEETPPRLVVEASLLWNMDRLENPLYIRLSTTVPFFDEEIPPAENAKVTVYTSNGKKYIFKEVEPGVYKHEGFPAEINVIYELEVIYNDQLYTATSQFVPTPEIEHIVQNDSGGFAGEDIELKAFYTDPAGKDNFYLFRFFNDGLFLQIYNDEFTDGNQSFALFSDEELSPGDEVRFEIQGISESFYNYMYILSSQTGTGGGPFQTQPTVVKGNVINTTNPDNYAFGYFRLSGTNILFFEVE